MWHYQGTPSGPFISHHGIKGQKWGVKNGPPYPLNQKTHNSVVSGDNDKLSRERYQRNKSREAQGKKTSGNKTAMSKWMSNELERNNTFIGRSFHNNDNSISGIGTYIDDVYGTRMSSGRNRNPMKILEETLRNVNVDPHGNFDRFSDNNRTHNCPKTSAATVLNLMGFEGVRAWGSLGGSFDGYEDYWFDGATHDYGVGGKGRSLDAFSEGAKKGSYGILEGHRYIDGKRAGGHSMTWFSDKNGSVKVADGQTGKIYNSISEAFKHQGLGDADFYDCTNAQPNWDHLQEDNVCMGSSGGKLRSRADQARSSSWQEWMDGYDRF